MEKKKQKTFDRLSRFHLVGRGGRWVCSSIFRLYLQGFSTAALAAPQPDASFHVDSGIAPVVSGSPAWLQAPLDLGVSDGVEEEIVVHGLRRKRDFPNSAGGDFEPAQNPAALPRDIRIVPPNSCPNAAYNTVAGQPATGGDLMGFLGSGNCY